jgi:hypothetical protein
MTSPAEATPEQIVSGLLTALDGVRSGLTDEQSVLLWAILKAAEGRLTVDCEESSLSFSDEFADAFTAADTKAATHAAHVSGNGMIIRGGHSGPGRHMIIRVAN